MVQQLVLHQEYGNFNGSFNLPDEMPAGNYRIRAYTDWMRNIGEEFFFTRQIFIGNSRLSNVETRIEYDVNHATDLPEITATIRFFNSKGAPVSGKEVSYEHVQIGRASCRERVCKYV